jgi:hypothetical protein
VESWRVEVYYFEKACSRYPTIPVTTVASESVFSTSGRIISPHRNRLAPNMVEALMCMQAWSRADMLGITCSSFGFVSLLLFTVTLTLNDLFY